MNKKRIKILTRGPIRIKGFINGPVLTPYFEDIAVIFAMLSAGVKIVEVCEDGTEIPLTTNNFADNNTKKEEEVAPVVEPIAEEIPVEIEPEPIMEVIPPVITLAEEVPTEESVFDDTVKEEVPAEEIVVEQLSVPEDTQEEVVSETVSASTEEKAQYQNNNYNRNNYNKNKNHKKNH